MANIWSNQHRTSHIKTPVTEIWSAIKRWSQKLGKMTWYESNVRVIRKCPRYSHNVFEPLRQTLTVHSSYVVRVALYRRWMNWRRIHISTEVLCTKQNSSANVYKLAVADICESWWGQSGDKTCHVTTWRRLSIPLKREERLSSKISKTIIRIILQHCNGPFFRSTACTRVFECR
jgi:hypothetical protein